MTIAIHSLVISQIRSGTSELQLSRHLIVLISDHVEETRVIIVSSFDPHQSSVIIYKHYCKCQRKKQNYIHQRKLG